MSDRINVYTGAEQSGNGNISSVNLGQPPNGKEDPYNKNADDLSSGMIGAAAAAGGTALALLPKAWQWAKGRLGNIKANNLLKGPVGKIIGRAAGVMSAIELCKTVAKCFKGEGEYKDIGQSAYDATVAGTAIVNAPVAGTLVTGEFIGGNVGGGLAWLASKGAKAIGWDGAAQYLDEAAEAGFKGKVFRELLGKGTALYGINQEIDESNKRSQALIDRFNKKYEPKTTKFLNQYIPTLEEKDRTNFLQQHGLTWDGNKVGVRAQSEQEKLQNPYPLLAACNATNKQTGVRWTESVYEKNLATNDPGLREAAAKEAEEITNPLPERLKINGKGVVNSILRYKKPKTEAAMPQGTLYNNGQNWERNMRGRTKAGESVQTI